MRLRLSLNFSFNLLMASQRWCHQPHQQQRQFRRTKENMSRLNDVRRMEPIMKEFVSFVRWKLTERTMNNRADKNATIYIRFRTGEKGLPFVVGDRMSSDDHYEWEKTIIECANRKTTNDELLITLHNLFFSSPTKERICIWYCWTGGLNESHICPMTIESLNVRDKEKEEIQFTKCQSSDYVVFNASNKTRR